MPNKVFVVIRLESEHPIFDEVLGVFADHDDAEKFAAKEWGLVVICESPYNP
jgi:hypothetical protein